MVIAKKWILGFAIALLAVGLFLGASGMYFAQTPPSTTIGATARIDYPLSPHPGISIGRDEDFTVAGAVSGCGCVRSGSGTQLDPYVIAGWVINASAAPGISVYGTFSPFIIANVVITGNSRQVGIKLDSVSNMMIEYSSITGNSVGIFAFKSEHLSVERNRILSNRIGIQLEASSFSAVLSNVFERNTMIAIFVRGPDNTISWNTVRASYGGINIDGTSGGGSRNYVQNNVVNGSSNYGIAMWRAAGCVVQGNTVTEGGVGIYLTDHSSNNTVQENNVTQNRWGGIYLESAGNLIRHNKVLGNGDGVSSYDLQDVAGNNQWEDNVYQTKKPDSLN